MHRFSDTGEKDNVPVLTLRPVAMRSTLSDKELSLPIIAPPTPLPLKQLRLMPPVREHLPDSWIKLCEGTGIIRLDGKDYFRDLELILLEHITHAEHSGGLDREGLFSFELDAVKEAKR